MNNIILSIAFAFLCCIKSSVGQDYLSYVCNSFSSYTINRAKNPNCYYSNDVFGSFEEIAQFYGYNTEVFNVVTEDQYILKLFRISPMKSTTIGAPVLLVHGTLAAATAYTIVGNRSLAFLLADEGYDVWVSNFRGTSYSEKHQFLNINDKKYWDFSFHEFGNYDLKSIINLVTTTTKQKVIYIGWSVGATAYYVYNIMNPDEAIKKVQVSISLAPTVYMHLSKTILIKFFEFVPYQISKATIDVLFPKGFLDLKNPAVVKFLLHFCFNNPFQILLCELTKDLVTGFNIKQEAPETFPVLLSKVTQPFIWKVGFHFVQLANSKIFQQFDYGKAKNLKRYGTSQPPPYNISLINVPIYLIYGPGDLLATEENVKMLHHELPKVAKPFGEPYGVQDDHFCHSDMVAAKNIKPMLNDHIITFLKENEVYFNN